MSTSESQANVAPAAPAKVKQEQSSNTEQAQQQQQTQQPEQAQQAQKQLPRAPKLAPAPVPQQTPWKATPIEHSADLGDKQRKAPTVVAAAAAAAASSSSKSSKDREQQGSGAKRATTGKEKWVPFAPVPIPSPQSQSGPASSGNSAVRNRSNKRQGGQGNNNNGNGMKNRRNPPNNDKRPRGAGHQRTQSRVRPDDASSSSGTVNNASGSNTTAPSASTAGGAVASDASVELEKLSLDDRQERRERNNGGNNNGNNQSNAGNTNNNSQNGRFNANGGMRNPQPRKTPRMGGNRVPFYQGNFIPSPAAVPYGMPVPMVPMATVIPATAPTEYILTALVQQVNYYFSTENLCKDMFLRKNMNNEGLVPLSVIAGFNRVKMLAPTADIVGQACAMASNIEIVGSKLRAVNNWQHWILPESERLPNGLDNSQEPASTSEQEPKFQVDRAVPFVPKSEQ